MTAMPPRERFLVEYDDFELAVEGFLSGLSRLNKQSGARRWQRLPEINISTLENSLKACLTFYTDLLPIQEKLLQGGWEPLERSHEICGLITNVLVPSQVTTLEEMFSQLRVKRGTNTEPVPRAFDEVDKFNNLGTLLASKGAAALEGVKTVFRRRLTPEERMAELSPILSISKEVYDLWSLEKSSVIDSRGRSFGLPLLSFKITQYGKALKPVGEISQPRAVRHEKELPAAVGGGEDFVERDRRLRTILLKTYRKPAGFLELVEYFEIATNVSGLDGRLDRGTDEFRMKCLIEYADSHGELDKLISVAAENREMHFELRLFAEEILLEVQELDKLKAAVGANLTDLPAWRTTMLATAGAVCQVGLGGQGVGTGFLIGRDVLLTNFHILQDVIVEAKEGRNGKAPNVEFWFNGVSKGPGVKVHLLPSDWLLAESDDLDYAIVKVEEMTGRKWLSCGAPRGPKPHDPILMFQCLKDPRPRLNVGSVMELLARHMVHDMKTAEGGAGSPCFSVDWSLVGLQQRLDSGQQKGTLLSAIREHLGDRTRLLDGGPL